MAKKKQEKNKKKAAMKKPVAKKGTAKKAPAKKAAPKKATPKAKPKKVAPKKPAKKTAPKKTVKKSPPKKAPAKKAPVKKAPPTKKPVVKKEEKKKPINNAVAKKENQVVTRYSDKDLQEFKTIILEKLEASRKELKYLHEQINRTAEMGGDGSDQKFTGLDDGTGTSEREYLSQMASRQIQYIDHLEKALVRIQNKTYGICRVTGKLISKERLRAVPHATLSIEAKNAQQQNK